MNPSARWLYPAAFLCLLLSGIAGLVYQVAWARYLALLLGHTSYAVVAVLVAFMGGLAAGNAWIGRHADRVSRPLALYAWLEIAIALYAFAFPAWFELCQDGYLALARRLEPGSPLLLALRFLVSLAAIFIPTTLMGGTLPVLTRLVTRSLGELRSKVAGLYFINSVGAVLGVFIAGFWWIPAFGLDATIFGGAILNAVVGAIALVVSAMLGESAGVAITLPTAPTRAAAAPPADPPAGMPAADTERYAPFEWRLAVAAAAASGFVAMLYEVVWTRLLALALGSSTHAFSLMLITFIGGIAVGAWWIGRWRGLKRTFDAFGWAELALALTLLGSMMLYHYLPYAFTRLGMVIARSPENHAVYQAAQFLLCCAVMFPPALCLGMTLPLASRVATAELARAGRSVGLVFSANTLGTVLGAALTGIVLLPLLGLARAFALGVGINLLIAAAVLCRNSARARRAVTFGAPLLVAAPILIAHLALHDTWNRAFSLGLWRVNNPPTNLRDYRAGLRDLDVRFHRDGPGSSVAVHGWTNPITGTVDLTLRVNGKPDASSRGDLSTQLLLGHLPLLLRPNCEEVMVVGIGSGVTCGAVLAHPGVQRLDAVEISREVSDAARIHFAPYNRRALEDPRTEVVLDDAKSFLKTSGRRYDVIISEPSNPWMAGVAGVFSQEFYATCEAALKEDGLMVQWVHIYESNDDALKTVVATFSSVFPFLTIWQTIPGDLVLIGSTRPAQINLDQLQQRFEEPQVRDDLRRVDIYSLPIILGLQLVSDYNAPFLVPTNTVVHSDYFPTLEYQAERAFFARREATLHEVFNESLLRRPGTLLGDYLRKHPLTIADAQGFALFHTSYRLPQTRILRSILERWRELDPDSTLPAEFSAKLDFPLPVSELEAQRMARVRDLLFSRAAQEPEPLRMYSRNLMHAYRAQRSAFYQPPTEELVAVLEHLRQVDVEHRQSHLLRLAEIAWDLEDDPRFFKLAAEAFVPQAGAPQVGKFDLDYFAPGHVLYLVIETLWRTGQYQDARLWCQAAREGGYLQASSKYFSPWLAMVVRKMDALALAALGPGGGTNAPPAAP